jgi:hypothetical protein
VGVKGSGFVKVVGYMKTLIFTGRWNATCWELCRLVFIVGIYV